ncbi:unnamed protein product [Microthlaspi erraticum]|uniref:F-box domain-containing protein n=1 Tax=Microthlaspi erraticum TaxID=1685480 RepID=A0A6D2HF18_9BRAS|nr:unnamed protein product [Microthlaspi erraticum]CAA7061334.1 unnamed protein product [Microthlaspi erraticum]
MDRGEEEVSDSILVDLILEIFSRLPAKSVGRLCSMSKLWCSMLSQPYFTELFLTRSRARPRLLFAIKRAGEWSFFSSPHQPRNPHGNESFVAAEFHTKFCGPKYQNICRYTSGLICFPNMWFSKERRPMTVVCNPITGQHAILPRVMSHSQLTSFLGFDPIGKKFKVLAEVSPFCGGRFNMEILTLETGQLTWRSKIDSPLSSTLREGLCINGVLYYIHETFERPGHVIDEDDYGTSDEDSFHVNIVCFDVRSEKFKLIEADFFCLDQDNHKLINYKGKLGGIRWEYTDNGVIELHLRVLEDVEKEVW